MRRAVAPRLAEEVRHAAVGKDRQALQASLWARAVAAQAFQSFAVVSAHGDARMYVEPRRFRHPRALARSTEASFLSRERHRRAVFREVHVGASEEGQLHARFERRELGRFVRAVFCCALVEETAAAQPATHALLHARGDVRDVGARGRGAFAKHHGRGGVRAEEPIGYQDVEVHKTPEARVELRDDTIVRLSAPATRAANQNPSNRKICLDRIPGLLLASSQEEGFMTAAYG